MAIVSIEERPQRTANFSKGFLRKYKRVFRVKTDSEQDGPLEVCYALPVALGDPYESYNGSESDPLSLCVDIDPQEGDSPYLWIITCTYEMAATAPQVNPSQRNRDGSGGGDSDDPTQWEPKITTSTGTLQLAMRRTFLTNNPADDVTRTPVVNSAGQPFSNPPMRNVKFTIVTHRRIETYDPAITFIHEDYIGSMNSIPWNSRERFCVALEDWQTEEIYIGTTLYHMHTRVFWIAPKDVENWLVLLLDAGPTDINGKQNLDPLAKSALGHDWPLNGSGAFLTPTQILAGEHQYVRFRDRKVRLFQNFTGVEF